MSRTWDTRSLIWRGRQDTNPSLNPFCTARRNHLCPQVVLSLKLGKLGKAEELGKLGKVLEGSSQLFFGQASFSSRHVWLSII